jgi:hypothetical protein
MAAFESQKKSARNLVLSVKSQLTPNDVFADASLTRRQRFDGTSVLELKQTRRSDKDMSGKGTEFATDGQLTSFDSMFNMKCELDDWMAGWVFAFCMGTDVVTGSGAPYTHAIGWDETTTQAKMTNVYLEDTAAVKTKYPDMAISEVTLNYASRGSVGLEVSMMGTGRWTDGAMMTLPNLGTYAYLLNSDTVFELGPVGSPASMVGRFMSATLKMSTAVVNHTAPGGGLYGLFMRTGLRKFSLEATIAAKDTDDVRTLFINDTLSVLTITTTSGSLPSILAVTIPTFKMKATQLGVDGNMVIWKVSLDETTAYGVGGDSVTEPITVSVQNSVPAYLVGV